MVKDARLLQKMLFDTFASSIGINSVGRVSFWECGPLRQRLPSIAILQRLCSRYSYTFLYTSGLNYYHFAEAKAFNDSDSRR